MTLSSVGSSPGMTLHLQELVASDWFHQIQAGASDHDQRDAPIEGEHLMNHHHLLVFNQ